MDLQDPRQQLSCYIDAEALDGLYAPDKPALDRCCQLRECECRSIKRMVNASFMSPTKTHNLKRRYQCGHGWLCANAFSGCGDNLGGSARRRVLTPRSDSKHRRMCHFVVKWRHTSRDRGVRDFQCAGWERPRKHCHWPRRAARSYQYSRFTPGWHRPCDPRSSGQAQFLRRRGPGRYQLDLARPTARGT